MLFSFLPRLMFALALLGNNNNYIYNLALALVQSNHKQKSRTKSFFTITAEIHARSLATFHGQYADRHMNLKFVRRVSAREREICYRKKTN